MIESPVRGTSMSAGTARLRLFAFLKRRVECALATGLFTATLAAVPLPALAQIEEEPDVEEEAPGDATDTEPGDEAAGEGDDASARVRVEDADAYPTAEGPRLQMAREHRPGAATYRLPSDRIWSPMKWDGGQLFAQTEIDVGYATYRYPERADRPRETLYDTRGRFVLGPMFHYDFPKSDYALNVVAQLVAWVREQDDEYQINVDDVYFQIAKDTTWDLQVGRFMTWRVYPKGLGFDLFTLEDNGASKSFPISNGDFAVHTYEVDYIFLRNSPYVGGEVAGRAAFHYYPADVLGFELATAYGLADNQGSNTLGARLAADLAWRFLRLSAAVEYRRQDQTGPPSAIQNAGTPDEVAVECTECGSSNNLGFGGGAILSFAPLTIGGGIARGIDEKFLLVGDAAGKPGRDLAASGKRFSFGGYLELDLGSIAFDRSLILGVGAQRTEYIPDNFNQEFHLQAAAYVALPLGINDAMVKLVVSQANADLYDATDPEGTAYIDTHPSSTTVRLRFSSNF